MHGILGNSAYAPADDGTRRLGAALAAELVGHGRGPLWVHRRHRLLVHRHQLQRGELLRSARLLHRRQRPVHAATASLAHRHRRGCLGQPLLDRQSAVPRCRDGERSPSRSSTTTATRFSRSTTFHRPDVGSSGVRREPVPRPPTRAPGGVWRGPGGRWPGPRRQRWVWRRWRGFSRCHGGSWP
jgi:hypothetical protein